jgi:pullulanase
VQRDVAKLTTMFRAQSLLVRENESGRVIEATALQVPGALDELYRRDEVHTDFGTTLAEKRTQFRVWAPTAQNISVCIHKGGTSLATQLIPLRSSKSSGTWSTQVNMNLLLHLSCRCFRERCRHRAQSRHGSVFSEFVYRFEAKFYR